MCSQFRGVLIVRNQKCGNFSRKFFVFDERGDEGTFVNISTFSISGGFIFGGNISNYKFGEN